MKRPPDPQETGPAFPPRLGAGPPGADARTPSPGHLFVVREVAEFPLEWAVIARDPRDPALLLVVPADTHPATGSADVRVPARSAAGPLALRCRFSVWVTEGFLAANVRTGQLEPADRSRAEQRIDELAHGPAPGDPLDRETDRDPEYLDWIAETVAPAAEALEDAARAARTSPTMARQHPHPRLSPSFLAAAALLLAVLGLSWRTLWLQHRIDDLSRPQFDAPHGEVPLGFGARTPDRSPVKVQVPPGIHQFLVTILLGSELPAGEAGTLEVQDSSGHPLWRSPPFPLAPPRELRLILSRDLLPAHTYRLVLYGRDHTTPLERRTLELETVLP